MKSTTGKPTTAKLTAEQKKFLKGLAHGLTPHVLIGKSKISDQLIDETNKALTSHELIKIKFNQGKEEKKSLAEEIASKTDSVFISMTGNTAILYRQQKVTEKRKIKLPH